MQSLTREHEFISSLILAESKTNWHLVGGAINQGVLEEETIDFGPLYCDKRLRNLFLAAPMMYRALSLQYKALQEFINLIDEAPTDSVLAALLPSFIEMQNGILLTQRVAQTGVADIANATGDDDAAPECTCAAKDMTFGRCCKVTPNYCNKRRCPALIFASKSMSKAYKNE